MNILVYVVLCAAMIAVGWFARGERIQEKIVYVQAEQAKEVKKVEEKKAEREIVYVDRIKVIHESQDNCLAQPLPPDILYVLRSSSAQPDLNKRLRISSITGGDLP